MEQITKLELLKIISLKNPIENNNFSFLTNYEEIKTLLCHTNEDIMKIFYFIKKNFHQILYDNEENVNISSEVLNKKFYNYFYLVLLITDNKNIINYKYTFEFINELNNLNKENNSQLNNLLYSKIIIDLLNNYKGFSEEDNYEQINHIEEFNKKMAAENIINIKKYNIYLTIDIAKNNIDEIYSQIISQLIFNIKSDNLEYIYDIISKLDLENIDLNKTMVEEICKALDNKINDKMICTIEDLEEKEKIDFYFVLLKFILKNSVYIYQISFLLKTRNNILKMIKSKDKNKIILNNEIFVKENKDRLDYIIKTLTDSEYYFKKFKSIFHFDEKGKNLSNKNNIKNKNEDKYCITKENNQIENFKGEKCTPTESRTLFPLEGLDKNIINKNKESLRLNFAINYKLNNKKDFNKELKNQYNNEFKNEATKINFQKLLYFLKKFNDIIQRKFANKNNLEIELEFQKEEEINNNDIDNFTCKYKLKNLKTIYKDQNILINGLNQGFQSLICDIEYEL